MNWKLIVLGVLALPIAAQAQTANVSLYGRANMDLEFVSGAQPGGANPTVARVSANQSRFGIRGTESLGGGLSAFFQLESNVSWDTGNAPTSGIASRETFVGLQSEYGRIWAGHSVSPYDDGMSTWGPTVINSNAAIINVASFYGNTSNDGGDASNGGYDERYSNVIRWDSPTMAGFTAKVQTSLFENTGHGTAIVPALFYNNGPIEAHVIYAKLLKVRCYNAANTSVAGCANNVAGDTLPVDDDAWAIASTYTFSRGQLSAHVEHMNYGTPTGTLAVSYWGISGVLNLSGADDIYAGYMHAGQGGGSASDSTPRINSLVHGADSGAQEFTIDYVYRLSPRTRLYAGYVRIYNEARANYTFNVNPYTIAVGGDPGGWLVGMVHNF